MNIREALRHGSRLLQSIGSDEASLEAELLLGQALGLDRTHLYQRLPDELTAAQEAAYRRLLERRMRHEPTAYIVGRREFYGIELEVTPAAIIPRPETETLVELALELIGPQPPPGTAVADVGVGCGAIAIALAANLPPSIQITAIDVSAPALELARRNARRLGLADRIRFLEGDLLSPLEGPVDIIAANLPYVPSGRWERLPPEIREHEPRSGLDGGPDGLRLIERLLRQAPPYLRPGGALLAEIGEDQGQEARRIASQAFPGAHIEVRPDLAGLDRVLLVRTRR